MLKKKSLLLAKIETVYGTDPTPAPANDSMLVENLDVKVTGEKLDRNFDRASLSSLPHVIGMKECEVTFRVELKGSGTADAGGAGDQPEIGPLLRACGYAETLTAESSGGAGDGYIEYDPVSASFESVTLYGYKDGIHHKVLGCRGTWKLNGEAGKFGTLEFTFKGLYQIPIDAAIPAGAVFNAQKPPIIFNASFTIGAYAAVIQAINIDAGIEVQPRVDANAAQGITEMMITGREMKGSINPEAVTRAAHDFWQNWENSVAEALAITIGSVAGAKIDITGPKLVGESIAWGERNAVRTYEYPFSMTENTGDDEIKLKFY